MNETISRAIQQLYDISVTPIITRPEPQFGDYATNVALQIAKQIGKNPREIAKEIAAELRRNEPNNTISVASPGFINITLNDQQLLAESEPREEKVRQSRRVVIETNNPNPFKAMHIGHAFNAVLADTIANIASHSGNDVSRVSYHGDVGLHVGKSMYSLLAYAGGDVQKLHDIPVDERNSFMSKMYAAGSRAYKESDDAKREIDALAQESFTLNDPLYKEIYELCKTWSFEQIDELVARLGNKPTVKRFLESDADARGVATVRQHVPDVFQESNGALVFEGSKYGAFDNAFVASNGRGLYAARDLGLMQLKNEAFQAEKSYIVTAEEQRDYFKGVIAAAELCLPQLRGVTTNISTGTVVLSTGKMSSRDGDVVEVSWLFGEFKRAIEARGGEATDEIVAGALRYQFLKVKIGSDVVFDINDAVSLHGNSGSYLQYAHARARSILAKTTVEPAAISTVSLNASERALVRKLGEYNDALAIATRELMPHHICTYLYELAQEFNRFYEKNLVVGSDDEAKRVLLVARYAETLRLGLEILGIQAPQKM